MFLGHVVFLSVMLHGYTRNFKNLWCLFSSWWSYQELWINE